ncbi:hypothetical protein B0T24DRAFT_61437 [Lasiosphaeria ovina]|uniref:Uncharacterized protein n=1 Tax=Lasiosphaeria ovina TaxID=92902 RepID=A0AAE0NLV4_9PEZI|nr:hypothetical protein B0T24DRAFT_61437 [Lasiosphaeria ovina]
MQLRICRGTANSQAVGRHRESQKYRPTHEPCRHHVPSKINVFAHGTWSAPDAWPHRIRSRAGPSASVIIATYRYLGHRPPYGFCHKPRNSIRSSLFARNLGQISAGRKDRKAFKDQEALQPSRSSWRMMIQHFKSFLSTLLQPNLSRPHIGSRQKIHLTGPPRLYAIFIRRTWQQTSWQMKQDSRKRSRDELESLNEEMEASIEEVKYLTRQKDKISFLMIKSRDKMKSLNESTAVEEKKQGELSQRAANTRELINMLETEIAPIQQSDDEHKKHAAMRLDLIGKMKQKNNEIVQLAFELEKMGLDPKDKSAESIDIVSDLKDKNSASKEKDAKPGDEKEVEPGDDNAQSNQETPEP